VPILTFGLYPWANRRGWNLTPLKRMGAGFVFASISFVICAWLQTRINAGETLSLKWQLVPYVVLELGEVLISATGLEFAYGQAPARYRGLVMSLWLVCTALGNFLVAVITRINSTFIQASGTAEFLFYAAFILVAAVAFTLIARSVAVTRPTAST
jgi:POT family proton-dependent oligopeptide transporter